MLVLFLREALPGVRRSFAVSRLRSRGCPTGPRLSLPETNRIVVDGPTCTQECVERTIDHNPGTVTVARRSMLSG